MKPYIKASLDAFNVSKNCDRSTSLTFYDSYIERKKKIIAGKNHALKKGDPVNVKKLMWEVTCFREVSENKEEALRYIDHLLKSSITLVHPNLIKEIDRIIGEEDTAHEN